MHSTEWQSSLQYYYMMSWFAILKQVTETSYAKNKKIIIMTLESLGQWFHTESVGHGLLVDHEGTAGKMGNSSSQSCVLIRIVSVFSLAMAALDNEQLGKCRSQICKGIFSCKGKQIAGKALCKDMGGNNEQDRCGHQVQALAFCLSNYRKYSWVVEASTEVQCRTAIEEMYNPTCETVKGRQPRELNTCINKRSHQIN